MKSVALLVSMLALVGCAVGVEGEDPPAKVQDRMCGTSHTLGLRQGGCAVIRGSVLGHTTAHKAVTGQESTCYEGRPNFECQAYAMPYDGTLLLLLGDDATFEVYQGVCSCNPPTPSVQVPKTICSDVNGVLQACDQL
jgi:hypothetical protein